MLVHTFVFIALTLFTVTSATEKDELLISRMANFSVDPCDSFYEYACGNFLKVFPNPEPKKKWTLFQLTKKEINKKLLVALNSEKIHASRAVKKAKIYYHRCLNEKKGELGSLLNVMKQLPDWPIFKYDEDWAIQKNFELFWEFSRALETALKYRAYPFFKVIVSQENPPMPLIMKPRIPPTTEFRFFRGAVAETLMILEYVHKKIKMKELQKKHGLIIDKLKLLQKKIDEEVKSGRKDLSSMIEKYKINTRASIQTLKEIMKFYESIEVFMLPPDVERVIEDMWFLENELREQKPDIRRLNLYHSSLDSIQCVYGAHPITGLNNDVKILINKTWSKQKNNYTFKKSSSENPFTTPVQLKAVTPVFSNVDIDLHQILNGYFDQKLPNHQVVRLLHYDYFQNLGPILSRFNKSTISSYINWRVIQTLVENLANTPFPTAQKLEKTYKEDKEKNEKEKEKDESDRKDACLQETIDRFEYPISRLYIDEYIKKEDKKKVKEIAKNIKNIASKLKLKYLDDASYANYKRKLNKAQFSVMYPAFMMDNTKLDSYFEAFQDDHDYINMNIQYALWRRNIDILNLKPSHDPDYLPVSQLELNAFVFHTFNRIYVLSGLTEKPLFFSGAPQEVQYGQIGVVLGHEMLHLFLGKGVQYDENGKKNRWVTSDSLKKLEKEDKCFADFYSKMTMFGQSVNGNLAKLEMMPEAGGIFLAYKALEKSLGAAKLKEKTSVPNLDLTKDKTFFLSYAQKLCSDYFKDSSSHLLRHPHTFNNIRMKGTLQNSKEFAEVFGCKSGSTYNPKDKCQLY